MWPQQRQSIGLHVCSWLGCLQATYEGMPLHQLQMSPLPDLAGNQTADAVIAPHLVARHMQQDAARIWCHQGHEVSPARTQTLPNASHDKQCAQWNMAASHLIDMKPAGQKHTPVGPPESAFAMKRVMSGVTGW